MPINPNIPLSIRGPQIESPFTALSQVLQAKKGLSELRTQQQEEADQAAIRQVLAETGGNFEEAMPRLRTIAPGAALKFETELSAQRKNAFEALKSETELEGKRLETGLKYLQGVRDDRSFQPARRAIRGLAPDVADLLGETYDPARVQQVLDIGLTAKDYNDKRKDALELFTKGDATKALGTWLSTTQTPEEWQAALEGARSQNVPEAIIQQFGPFSPENVQRAGTLTMSPKERAELANQAGSKAPAIGSFEDYLAREAVQRGQPLESYTTQDIDAAREKYRLDPRITINTPRPITQTAEAGLITRLNSQWTTATKPARELAQQLTTMRLGLAAAERGDLAQGTEAVLQPFLKILDPNSVVREGEFFRLREGQSYLARARGITQRLTQGGFVPLAELKKYAALAEEIAKRQDSYVSGVRGRIGKVAERYNIPEELVFETEAPPTDTRTTTPTTATTPGTGPKVGERRMINGRLAEWKTINGQSGWVAVQ